MTAGRSSRPPLPIDVLLIDGSRHVRAVERAFAEARPALRVAVDTTGSGWRERFAAGRTRVVIVDRCIGAQEGLAILARIRELDPLCAKVVCAREPDVAHAIEALRLGCDDYVIREGAWIDELVGRVLGLVDRRDEPRRSEIPSPPPADLREVAPVVIPRPAPLRRSIAAMRTVRDEPSPWCWVSTFAAETTSWQRGACEERVHGARPCTLADVIPDVVCVFDAELRCVYWNRAAECLTGRKAQAMIGRPIAETLPELVGTPSYALLVRALEQQTMLQVELTMGIYLTPGTYDVRMIGANGVVAMMARDVTERVHVEERLRSALTEKQVLLQEIHHRVKNNLQVVSSLLNLKLRAVHDEAVRTQVADMQGRVLAMSLVHEYLYRAGDLGKLDLREYLGRLVEGSLAVLDRSSSVRARVSIDDVTLDLDVAMRLGLVVHELVSNACKHAWPDGSGGTLRIRFGRCVTRPTLYDLVVEDDGVGMSRSAPSHATLGLELVERLLAPLHGAIRIESPGGTRVTVQFEVRSP